MNSTRPIQAYNIILQTVLQTKWPLVICPTVMSCSLVVETNSMTASRIATKLNYVRDKKYGLPVDNLAHFT